MQPIASNTIVDDQKSNHPRDRGKTSRTGAIDGDGDGDAVGVGLARVITVAIAIGV